MDDADLQVDGAEPGYRVGQVFPFADQCLERFALAAGAGEVHNLKPCLVVPELKPDNLNSPALGTLPDKLERGGVFLAGIGEGDDHIAQVIVVVQYLAQHVCAGPPAGEAHDGGP
ncbi:hypothetical protein D3C85_1399470 [compost metagenome]